MNDELKGRIKHLENDLRGNEILSFTKIFLVSIYRSILQ